MNPNDLMNPLNPLSPLSPISPLNPASPIWDDGPRQHVPMSPESEAAFFTMLAVVGALVLAVGLVCGVVCWWRDKK